MTIEILGMKFRVIYLISIALLAIFIFTNIITCTCRMNKYDIFSWARKLMTKQEGMEVMSYNDSMPKYGDAVASHEQHDISGAKKVIDIDQAEADIALQENKMFIFSNTKFLPECCPNAYSTGQGCACISDKVRNHIGTRGGNN